MARRSIRCGLNPTASSRQFWTHQGDRDCPVCVACTYYDTCLENNMRHQLDCPAHQEGCGDMHWATVLWLQPDGRWLLAPESVREHGDRAIELIISLLKERARRQPMGFTISSRTTREALRNHFGHRINGIQKIDELVTDALFARGIIQSHDKSDRREVFAVDADSAHKLLEDVTLAIGPY